jgi:hypothetical protein
MTTGRILYDSATAGGDYGPTANCSLFLYDEEGHQKDIVKCG